MTWGMRIFRGLGSHPVDYRKKGFLFLILLFSFVLFSSSSSACFDCMPTSGLCKHSVELCHTEFQLHLLGGFLLRLQDTAKGRQGSQGSAARTSRPLRVISCLLDLAAVLHHLPLPRDLLHNPFGYNHSYSNDI